MTLPKILMDLSNPNRGRDAEHDSSPSGYEYFRLRNLRLIGLLRTKAHQFRSLLRNRDLIRAVLVEGRSGDGIPIFDIGDVLKVYGDDGRCVRLAIRGSRTNALFNSYYAVDLDDLMPCCVKACRETEPTDPGLEEMLRQEASLSLRIPPHPNLVKTLEAFFYRKKLYLRSEYFPATALDRIVERGPLGIRDALNYAVQLCRALVAVQAVFPGFVHGNINPGSCLISRDGNLKLSDLGQVSTSRSGIRTLSPTMSPEVLCRDPERNGQRFPPRAFTDAELPDFDAPLSISGDVYSFGLILLEMICGRRQVTSLLDAELTTNQAISLTSSKMLLDRDIFPELADLVLRCLSSSQDRRPTDFLVLAHQLDAMIEEKFPGSSLVRSVPELTEAEIARRAISLSLLGSSGAASEYIDSTLGGTGLSASVLNCKVKVNLLEGRIDDAIEASRTALRMGTERCASRIAYARTLMADSRFETALDFVFRAIKLEPNNRQALVLAGDLLQSFGEFDEASYFLHRCLAQDPRQPDVMERLARLNFMRGKFDLSIKFGMQAVKLDPWNEKTRRTLGDVYFAKGSERFKAIGSFKAALRSSGTCSAGSRDAARKFVRCSLSLLGSSGCEISLETVKLLILGSRLLSADGVVDRSTSFTKGFARVFRNSDLDQMLLFCLDDALVRSISFAKGSAVSDLRTSLVELMERSEAIPLQFNPLFSLSKVLFHLGAYSECQTTALESIRRFGPNEAPYFQIAASYEKQGELRSARQYYKKALKISRHENTLKGVRRVKAALKQSRWSYIGNLRSHLRRVGLIQ